MKNKKYYSGREICAMYQDRERTHGRKFRVDKQVLTTEDYGTILELINNTLYDKMEFCILGLGFKDTIQTLKADIIETYGDSIKISSNNSFSFTINANDSN